VNGVSVSGSSTNTNGSYIKLYDGTMICWLHTSSAVTTSSATNISNVYSTAQLTWTFPATFYAEPTVIMTPERNVSTGYVLGGGVNDATTTLCYYYLYSAVSGESIKCMGIAIGRWRA
jgi:hypothetical protein